MYGIYAHIWGVLMVNVTIYSIHTDPMGNDPPTRHQQDIHHHQAVLVASQVPCDIMKRLLPRAWSTDPFFRQIDELEGIPVINIHLWFDRKRLGISVDWMIDIY